MCLGLSRWYVNQPDRAQSNRFAGQYSDVPIFDHQQFRRNNLWLGNQRRYLFRGTPDASTFDVFGGPLLNSVTLNGPLFAFVSDPMVPNSFNSGTFSLTVLLSDGVTALWGLMWRALGARGEPNWRAASGFRAGCHGCRLRHEHQVVNRHRRCLVLQIGTALAAHGGYSVRSLIWRRLTGSIMRRAAIAHWAVCRTSGTQYTHVPSAKRTPLSKDGGRH